MKKERNTWWLIVGISGISALAWLTNSYNPDTIHWLLVFFLLLFVCTTALALFVTNIVRRSVLIGGGVVVFFFLRLLGLREPLYLILLIASLISLELYLNKR